MRRMTSRAAREPQAATRGTAESRSGLKGCGKWREDKSVGRRFIRTGLRILGSNCIAWRMESDAV
jgi:hypothetical protein